MAKTITTAWDSTEMLDSEERITAYISAVFEDAGNDPAYIAHALGNVAKARGMAQLSRDTGLTRASLYKALSGEGNPEFATICKVAGALGLRWSLVP